MTTTTTTSSNPYLCVPPRSVLLSIIVLATVVVILQTCITPPTEQELYFHHDSSYNTYGIAEEEEDDESLPSFLRHARRLYDQYNQPHKPLRPLNNADKLGFFFTTLGLMIAAGGGIGGGGVLVPIYILVMQISPKHAIPLSNITVFGGAIANTMLNWTKRHPYADRPLVDWDLILVMEPLTIAGALLGAFLNKLLPEELLVVMLVLLLSYTAYTTLKKAVTMYKKETAALMAQEEDGDAELRKMTRKEEEENEEDQRRGLLANMEDTNDDNDYNNDVEQHKEEELGEIIYLDDEQKELAEDLNTILSEERVVPTTNVLILFAMFVVVLFINLVKGGGAYPSPLGIKCGSTSFWIANMIMLGWIGILTVFARSYLLHRYYEKERVGYTYVEGDIKWDGRATIVYPTVCCAAGFFAGMFGIGGGIVKGPLMLAMGVHPAVSSASSACMILFTSFTATTSFVVFGLLIPDYAAVCVMVGFFATWVGQILLWYLMQRFQRNSYIAFSIGGIVLLSAFLMTIQSLVSLIDKDHHAKSGGICG